LVSRLRDAIAMLGREHLDEITAALRQLVEDPALSV
jgi:hypothetical protein